MRSNDCTKSSSGGSRPKPFCHPPTPPRCYSGRYLHQGRSTCARSMVGKRLPQSPLISQLTLPPEAIPSCDRRMRHTEFQPHSGRHLQQYLQFLCYIERRGFGGVGPFWRTWSTTKLQTVPALGECLPLAL